MVASQYFYLERSRTCVKKILRYCQECVGIITMSPGNDNMVFRSPFPAVFSSFRRCQYQVSTELSLHTDEPDQTFKMRVNA